MIGGTAIALDWSESIVDAACRVSLAEQKKQLTCFRASAEIDLSS
jgi:hypothetical protein